MWSHSISSAGRSRLAPILTNLYDGAAGLILLLAAAYRISGGTDYRDCARAGLQPLAYDFTDPWRRQQQLSFMGAHGLQGVASLLYAGCLIQDFLGDGSADALLAAGL